MENISLEQDIKLALETLKKGGLILYPTDTVWGIGCDATRAEAVEKIFHLKRRADSKSMIVLLDDAEKLERYVDVPEVGYELINAAVEPLTIVFDNAVAVAKNLIAPDGTLAVRITREEVSSRLCRALKRPLVSTSANVSGNPTPMSFSEISPEILSSVDYVMQSRHNEIELPKPSTIIKLSADGQFKILRK